MAAEFLSKRESDERCLHLLTALQNPNTKKEVWRESVLLKAWDVKRQYQGEGGKWKDRPVDELKKDYRQALLDEVARLRVALEGSGASHPAAPSEPAQLVGTGEGSGVGQPAASSLTRESSDGAQGASSSGAMSTSGEGELQKRMRAEEHREQPRVKRLCWKITLPGESFASKLPLPEEAAEYLRQANVVEELETADRTERRLHWAKSASIETQMQMLLEAVPPGRQREALRRKLNPQERDDKVSVAVQPAADRPAESSAKRHRGAARNDDPSGAKEEKRQSEKGKEDGGEKEENPPESGAGLPAAAEPNPEDPKRRKKDAPSIVDDGDSASNDDDKEKSANDDGNENTKSATNNDDENDAGEEEHTNKFEVRQRVLARDEDGILYYGNIRRKLKSRYL